MKSLPGRACLLFYAAIAGTAVLLHGCAIPSQQLSAPDRLKTADHLNTVSIPIERDAAPRVTKPAAVQIGKASWYGPGFHGRKTASGEVFDQHRHTAAHPSLPLGSRVRVTRLDNEKSVEVEINDRGPFVEGRIIDLSRAAAQALDMTEDGVVIVRVEILATATEAAQGNDSEPLRRQRNGL